MTIGQWIILWIIASGLGALTSLFAIFKVKQDLANQIPFANGTKVLGTALLVVEFLRLLIQVLWFGVGYLSYNALAEVNGLDAPLTTPSVPTLVVTNFILFIKTMIWLRARHQVSHGRDSLF